MTPIQAVVAFLASPMTALLIALGVSSYLGYAILTKPQLDVQHYQEVHEVCVIE